MFQIKKIKVKEESKNMCPSNNINFGAGASLLSLDILEEIYS